jgi:hypothetical protein
VNRIGRGRTVRYVYGAPLDSSSLNHLTLVVVVPVQTHDTLSMVPVQTQAHDTCGTYYY